jgi:hypothetical protein
MHNHFLKLKQNLEPNPSFDQTVQARHAAVRSTLQNKGAAIKETKLIGSLQRKTRIQPRPDDQFDIDILVVLGEFNRWLTPGDPNGITPEIALNYVYTSVNQSDRYSAKNPKVDAPTIELQFRDNVKVELVPAYLDMIGQSPDGKMHSPIGRGYWIPKRGQWELADYDFEADYITNMNIASDGYLVPTIKMLKAMKRTRFPFIQSFPLEIIATRLIPFIVSYKHENNQLITYPELIKLFCILAKKLITEPIQIPGSNSPMILLNPMTVQLLDKALSNIIDHIQTIEGATSDTYKAGAWRLLFGEAFPATLSI